RNAGSPTTPLDWTWRPAAEGDASDCRNQPRLACREDLYHRLNVVALLVPPLRERADDIPALAAHFVERARRAAAAVYSHCAPSSGVRAYPWPGNVRERRTPSSAPWSWAMVARGLAETVLDSRRPLHRFRVHCKLPSPTPSGSSSSAPGKRAAPITNSRL